MQKKFFVLFNIFSQFGFKLFLSFFFYRDFTCHLSWTMPVALITAADGVCHPTSAALIIGRQRRHSIYPDRPAPAVPGRWVPAPVVPGKQVPAPAVRRRWVLAPAVPGRWVPAPVFCL